MLRGRVLRVRGRRQRLRVVVMMLRRRLLVLLVLVLRRRRRLLSVVVLHWRVGLLVMMAPTGFQVRLGSRSGDGWSGRGR
jgi:hypothetical protein